MDGSGAQVRLEASDVKDADVVCFRAVEQCDRVVCGGAGFCVVGDQGLAGCPVESHALVAQCEVADFWVVERFVSAGMTMYVVAAPQAGEFRAFEDQLADDRGQIGRVRLQAGEGSQVGNANPELGFPVVEQRPSCGVEEGVTPDVALRNGPVGEVGEQPQAARIPG